MFGGGDMIPPLAYISSEDNISRMEQVAKLLKPSEVDPSVKTKFELF